MSITREKRKMKVGVEPLDVYYLKHGTTEGCPSLDEETELDFFLRTNEGWLNLWRDQREKVMESWIREHPCTRPWAFWRFEGEPRLRVGGVGTPSHEVLAISPCYEFGLPTSFVSEFEIKHFPHLRGMAIDLNDPPQFESETAYLSRHDLLSPQEKKYIAGHPELLEPEILKFTENKKE